MGRSTTPTYRIEVTGGFRMTNMAWQMGRGFGVSYGKPTDANLAKLIQDMNESMAPGGVNGHLSAGRATPARITKAQVVRQSTDKVVATYAAPMFEVLQ